MTHCSLCAMAILRFTHVGICVADVERSRDDASFARYPRLPISGCRGYEHKLEPES